MPTIRDILAKTSRWFAERGIDSHSLDAQVLVAHALRTTRLKLFMEPERELTEAELATCREAVRRRGAREPVAYIVGHKEFLGFDFRITSDVLIPRPETELLVETGVAFLRERFGHAAPARRLSFYDIVEAAAKKNGAAVAAESPGTGEAEPSHEEPPQPGTPPVAPLFCDVGTGSGILAIALARLFPSARGWALDASDAALAIARENARALGVADRLTFATSDVTALVGGESLPRGAFDLVVSNPPYIAEAELPGLAPELAFEPRLALTPGADGVAMIRRLIDETPALLKPGGLLAMEIASEQVEPVRALFASSPAWRDVRVRKDLAGLPRVMCALMAG